MIFVAKKQCSLKTLKSEIQEHNGRPGGTPGRGLKIGTVPAKTGRMVSLGEGKRLKVSEAKKGLHYICRNINVFIPLQVHRQILKMLYMCRESEKFAEHCSSPAIVK